MRWVAIVLAIVLVASRTVARPPWGDYCPPGYHAVFDEQGGYTCEPDSPVDPGSGFSIWWPVDPTSVVSNTASAAVVVVVGTLGLACAFYLVRRLVRAVSREASPSLAVLACGPAQHISLDPESPKFKADLAYLQAQGDWLHVDAVEHWEETYGEKYTGKTYDDYAGL